MGAGFQSISDAERGACAAQQILVAEDNPLARRLVVRQLERLGYKVDEAADGREVLEALKHANYAAVLMDCEMPEVDGFEATREIRRMEGAARHTQIIAVTAHEAESEREKCRAAGMDDFAIKPLKSEALARMLAPAAPAMPAPAAPTPSAATPDSPPILDRSIIAELRDDQELLDDLIETFTNQIPERITRLADDFARGDLEAASADAHSLKGSAANLGAMRMRSTCAALDMSARNGAVENVPSLLAELRAMHREACLALAAERSVAT